MAGFTRTVAENKNLALIKPDTPGKRIQHLAGIIGTIVNEDGNRRFGWHVQGCVSIGVVSASDFIIGVTRL
jgi:hypothetical protein